MLRIFPRASFSADERTGSAASLSSLRNSLERSFDIFLKSRCNSRSPRTLTAPVAIYGATVPQLKRELDAGANSYSTSSTSFSVAAIGNE